jgi:26S proteasome non-ATPase regulatory subunit 10
MSEQQMDQNEAVPLLPVHIAVMKDNVALLQKLIQSGATQLDQKTYETALHVAARAPSLQCLRWLLDNNINSARDRDCKGSTPCHYAVVYSNLEALEILLNHNPKEKKELSEIKDDNGLTIMGLATLQNDLQMVQWTVERFPGLAHIRDNRGNLPIHLAAAGGSLGIVKLLVNRYGSKYAEESGTEKKFQPLYYAVDKGHIDIVKYLIDEVKVDPLAKAQGGMTTLHAAVTAHQVQITEWLVEKLGPGRILERSDDGATLLHLAAAEGLADLLQFLIDHLQDKSSINVKDDLASTPAHDAAEFGEHSTLLVLLKNGADITMLNQNTETPFDLAVQNSHNDLIAMMNDFREHGLKGLAKYGAQVSGEQVPPEPAPNEPVPNEQVSVEVEVTMQSSSSGLEKSTGSVEPVNMIKLYVSLFVLCYQVRTSKVEALEITNLINEATDISEKRKEEKLTRHKSLQELILTDDNNNDSGEEIELQLMKNKENSQANISKTNDTEEVDVVIPHEISPEGEIYAKVNKPKKKKNTRRKDEQTDDVVSSHVSSPKSQVSSNRVARLNNAMNKPYKKTSAHRMSENESVSSLSTSVSHSKRSK